MRAAPCLKETGMLHLQGMSAAMAMTPLPSTGRARQIRPTTDSTEETGPQQQQRDTGV